MAAVLFGLGSEREADVGALRCGEVDVLDHDRHWLRIQINDRQRLLAAISLGAELKTKATIDRDQIPAFAVRAILVGRADEIYRERSNGWQSGRQVQEQRSGRCDRAPF